MSKNLISMFWVATLVGAFFIGRMTVNRSPGQDAVSHSNAPSGSVLGSANVTGKAASKADADSSEAAPKKPNVKSLIAAMRVQMQGGNAMFMNPSAMMKLMAPIADLSPEEIKEALAEVEKTIKAPQQKMMLYAMLLGRMAETDGPGAVAYADIHLEKLGPMGQGAKMGAMSTWAQSDPDAAWEYYQKKQEEGDEPSGPFGGSRMMLSPIFSAMAAKDLESTLVRLKDLEDNERMMAMNGVVQGAAWDEERRDTLLAATNEMDLDLKQQMQSQLVSQWAMMDAEGALDWASDLPEDERGPLLQAVTGPLMMTNPKRGAEVLIENASAEEKANTYANIVSQWAHQDPNAAGEWLGQQPQGPELDQARSRFSATVASRDPESAMAWAMAVEDSDQRFQAIQTTYHQWSQKDADAANVALEGAGLSDEQMQSLRPAAETAP